MARGWVLEFSSVKDELAIYQEGEIRSKRDWFSRTKHGELYTNILTLWKKQFILTYFLGGKPKEAIQLISALKNTYDSLEVVHLEDLKDVAAYKTGPEEFLGYINSAKAVLTDSFHGMVFPIIMETPFVVYERIGTKSMYSRIETILSALELKDREDEMINSTENLFKVNFDWAKSL